MRIKLLEGVGGAAQSGPGPGHPGPQLPHDVEHCGDGATASGSGASMAMGAAMGRGRAGWRVAGSQKRATPAGSRVALSRIKNHKYVGEN